jgi:hypothetical protein
MPCLFAPSFSSQSGQMQFSISFPSSKELSELCSVPSRTSTNTWADAYIYNLSVSHINTYVNVSASTRHTCQTPTAHNAPHRPTSAGLPVNIQRCSDMRLTCSTAGSGPLYWLQWRYWLTQMVVAGAKEGHSDRTVTYASHLMHNEWL